MKKITTVKNFRSNSTIWCDDGSSFEINKDNYGLTQSSEAIEAELTADLIDMGISPEGEGFEILLINFCN